MPEEPKWIAELAIQERERREGRGISVRTAREFSQSLSEQIEYDLSAYFREFPKEQPYIQTEHRTPKGLSRITRVRDEQSTYGFTCAVEFGCEISKMVFTCSFAHQSGLDKDFPIELKENGSLGPVGCSITDLSEYLLKPVLFNRLFGSGTAASA
jgi:hypothetical protein